MTRRRAGAWAAVLFVAFVACQDAAAAAWEPLWPDAPEIEEFLKESRVTARRKIGTGVTSPEQVTLEQDGTTRLAIWKVVDREYDSCRYEVAAYRIDRRLGIGRVPPTIMRRMRGREGCLQLWVEGEPIERRTRPPADLAAWREQVSVMWLFDDLIGNVDRHLNNGLATADDKLVFIDNSRAFDKKTPLRNNLNRRLSGTQVRYWFESPASGRPTFDTTYPPELIARLRSLTDDELGDAVRGLLWGEHLLRLRQRRKLVVERLAELQVP
jgi:hypothetical protein